MSFAAFKNFDKCFAVIMNHAKQFNLPSDVPNYAQQKLSQWVDQPTDEDFTALHFASFHGNVEMIIKLVEEYQCNLFKKNIFGASCLHIAS